MVKWSEAVTAWLNANRTAENQVRDGLWKIQASGHALSLLQLAFDVFCLQQVNRLPDSLVHRLRDNREFQGVRYEIGVASIFARAGYSIGFCEDKFGEKICEFIARHPSGLSVAVEAKSRRRPGVLNEKGRQNDTFRMDLKKLYAKARKKKPAFPFIIFLDANLPPTPDIPWERSPWLQDLKDMFGEFPEPTAEQPDPHNLVVITNYGFYYDGDGPSRMHPPLYAVSQHPKYLIPQASAWLGIQEAIERYTSIPNEL